jgi:hypothetical protein
LRRCWASVQRFEMVRALNSRWKAHMNPLAESVTPQLELHERRVVDHGAITV